MNGTNKVILVGNLGSDPEHKLTQGGVAVLKMRLAINESWNDGNGQGQSRVEWVSVNLWGKAADALSKFLSKGMLVYVEGQMRTSTFEKDGQKHYRTEVRADRCNVLTPRGENAERNTNQDAPAGRRAAPPARGGGGSTTTGGHYAPPVDPQGQQDWPDADDEIPF